MRTRQVRLAALVFALALLVAVAGSAWIASRIAVAGAGPGAGEASGRELFRLHCARCHSDVETLAPELHGPDPGTAVLALLDFLDEHGDADAREDRAILAHLLQAGR